MATGLTEGTHTIKVKAKSRSGLWSEVTEFTIKVDLTDPTVSGVTIDDGSGGSRLRGHQSTFRIQATTIEDALSGIKTTKFYWSYDGVVWKDEVVYNGTQLSHTYTNKDLRHPAVYGKIIVEDNAGNTAEQTAQLAVDYVGLIDYGSRVEVYKNLPRGNR